MALIVVCVYVLRIKIVRRREDEAQADHCYEKKWISKSFLLFNISSAMICYVIIYTLDEGFKLYLTPVYIPFALSISAALLFLARAAIPKKNLAIILGCVMCLYMLNIWGALQELSALRERNKTSVAWEQIVAENKGNDCIYIEKQRQSTFFSTWFEFGEYDEFKIILSGGRYFRSGFAGEKYTK